MKRDRVLRARDELREHCKGNQYNCSACIFQGGANGCTLYGVPHTWREVQHGRTGKSHKVAN